MLHWGIISLRWTDKYKFWQTDKNVYYTKLHGWETLAKIKNNRYCKGHPKFQQTRNADPKLARWRSSAYYIGRTSNHHRPYV